VAFCFCLFCIDLSTNTLLPLESSPVQYIMVDSVDGVGVNTCTCSGAVLRRPLQNASRSRISSSVQPGWAAMK
jgi:hypothetical protein